MKGSQVGGDAALLRLVADGSTTAFDELYWRHAPAVTRYAWATTSTRESAQEVLQDTFVTLWQNADRIRLAGDSLLPWLLVTCRNHAANARRAESRGGRLVAALKQRQRDVTAAAPSPDDLRWVTDAIEQLPPRDRAVAILCLVEGRTYKQAADELNISEAALGKRLQRTRLSLRKELAPDDTVQF